MNDWSVFLLAARKALANAEAAAALHDWSLARMEASSAEKNAAKLTDWFSVQVDAFNPF